ncbi:MAG TPA: glycosyltransferase family 4 protein [Ferruginibacter sp.]|jgi:glycosyltransferase involved in cell wall biosynthesis|nr:glycosyltransferase family 4 protein [Ferruginibacter sp.]
MNKKILIITYVVPYPANLGGQISIFGTINYLRFFFNITLVIRIHTHADKENIEKLKRIWPEVSIETVTYYHEKTALNTVKNYLYRSAYKLKEKVKKIFVSPPADTIQNRISFYPFLPADVKFCDFLENLLSKNEFAIIQIEYTDLLNLVHLLPSKAVKIFVQIENRYSILQDYFNKINNKSLYAKYIIENARAAEIALIDKYDHVIALNKNDKENLSKYLPAEKIVISSFPILNNLITSDINSTFSKNNLNKLIFLGSQGHLPNEDAVKWFIEEMYDKIYQQYKLKLYITGKWEKDFTKKYPQVIFTGFVDDVSPLIKNSIVISPIRLGGGGLRAKVLQAMAMRVPLVSTALGSEGIEGIKNNENIFIANTPKEFITSIQNIVENELHTNQVINNAFEVIQMHYTEKAVGKIRKDIYNKIIDQKV